MKHYLNNAGAAIVSSRTMEAMIDYLRHETEVGGYRAARESQGAIDQFYARASRLVNASGDTEIAYVDSASRAWNLALAGVDLGAGDRIVTLSTEFGTNLVTLFYRARQAGAAVDVVRCDAAGDFSVGDVEAALERGANLVAISHVAMHGSIVNPVKEIGRLATEHDATFLLDGCQAVGQLPVDVREIGCDAYTATGRKWLRGPRGTGFLYVSPSAGLRETEIDLASAELVVSGEMGVTGVKLRKEATNARRFELWERNIAAMLGLSTAMEECLEQNPRSISVRVRALANKIRRVISENPSLLLVGQVDSVSGVVGFYVRDPKREDLVRRRFAEEEIEISTIGDWDCPLHFPHTGVTSVFRLSPHYYTPDSTVDRACEVLSEL